MITSDRQARLTPGMQILSPGQRAEIHQATLELLRKTGVRVLVGEVRDLLRKAGCWVDEERVRIPPHLIDWAIRTAPSRVVLSHRDASSVMELEGRKGYYGTGSDTPFVVDPYTGERRSAVLEDIANVARIVDALPNVDFLMCMGIASNVPESISDIYHFKTMTENCKKPIVYTAWNRKNLEVIIDLAETVAGGAAHLQQNPFCALYSEPISPLTHAKDSCEKLLFIAKKGLPVVYTPGMMIGGSAPVTIAGALVQANAEQLSGLLICQLIREGTPVVCGGGVLYMDMQHGLISYAAPEFMLAMSALSEVCHDYHLPIFSFAGCSDSKVFDQQAAAEGSLWMLVSALSGGNLIHDLGYLEGGLTCSYELLVSMDEIGGLVKRFMQGIDVDQETLALEVIDRVGPGGHYITDDHTYKHFKRNWFPKLLDRSTRGDWEINGEKSLADRAREKAQNIIEEHRPEPLTETIQQKMDEILEEAEAKLVKQGS
jgi:trimethylamine--corrinoid protein Co-methyltransferase